MEIVGAIFSDETTLNLTLEALQEAGFQTYMVFGADDFSGEPGIDDEGDSPTQQHTAAGTFSGITHTPPAGIPDDPSTETIEDELMAIGLSHADAQSFVDALHNNSLLLLVQTWTGQTEDAEQILQSHEGKSLRRIHPTDAFPEELWRKP